MNTNHKQQGMVLMISLVLLLLLTIIAVTATSVSTLQLRMASNSQQQNIAFQAAESGLRQGQQMASGEAPATGTLNLNSGTPSNGLTSRYRVETEIVLLSGSSLDAAGEGGGALPRYQVRISSHGKACDSATCDPSSTADNSARSQHLLGCIRSLVVAPLCN